tara:strand:+ start:14428 stop:15753 length:1326 start_codon:yes stop_codon:yes gene_type:complete
MKNKYLPIYIILIGSILIANSRVAFSRPGSLIRASVHESYDPNKLFSISIGSEISSIGKITSHSSSFALNKTNMNGTSWGLSYTLLPYTGIDENIADADIDYEIGAHFQTNLYSTGRTNITAGIHDFLLNDDETISIKDLSLFMNFSNDLSINNYNLTTVLGLGSGRIAFDPHTSYTTSSGFGLFAALRLNTPYLRDWGGVDLITEFLHSGLNIALSIPFTKEYKFSLGVTHIENLSDFSNQSDDENPQALEKDSPAVCVGLDINLPKINSNKTQRAAQEYPILFINGRVDSSLFQAGQYIYYLQDSLSILKQELNTISGKNTSLILKNKNFQDSLNNVILQSNINDEKHNKAMRHLSKSLRLYYQGDFKQALNEVDIAISLQPNTAIAYARKGSIYYKLNQLDRATLNWNIALKLDPEYEEVREMLNALKENKLRSLSTN